MERGSPTHCINEPGWGERHRDGAFFACEGTWWPLDAWLATPRAPAGMAKNRIFGLETATAVDEKAIHSRALSQDGRAFRYVPWCSAHLPQRTLSGHPGEDKREKEALSLMLYLPLSSLLLFSCSSSEIGSPCHQRSERALVILEHDIILHRLA